jgi:hypothetical protein
VHGDGTAGGSASVSERTAGGPASFVTRPGPPGAGRRGRWRAPAPPG